MRFLIAWILAYFMKYGNGKINGHHEDTTRSLLSIRNFKLNVNCSLANPTTMFLSPYLEIYTNNDDQAKRIGGGNFTNTGTFTLIDDNPVNFSVFNSLSNITINFNIRVEYYDSNANSNLSQTLLTISDATYVSNTWTSATSYWNDAATYTSWYVVFEYLKSCEGGNYGFYCNQMNITTSTSTTPTSSTWNPFYNASSTIQPYYYCQDQIAELEDQRDKERHRKNVYFWIMIGLIVLSVILLILMLLFCCCWMRDRGKVVQKNKVVHVPRDRVDIVHPHTYPEERQTTTTTVRQRTLPPYRPPQPQPRTIPSSSQPGPIDASSNIIPPRTTPYYGNPNARHFQYPSDDEWSIAPGEHAV